MHVLILNSTIWLIEVNPNIELRPTISSCWKLKLEWPGRIHFGPTKAQPVMYFFLSHIFSWLYLFMSNSEMEKIFLRFDNLYLFI